MLHRAAAMYAIILYTSVKKIYLHDCIRNHPLNQQAVYKHSTTYEDGIQIGR